MLFLLLCHDIVVPLHANRGGRGKTPSLRRPIGCCTCVPIPDSPVDSTISYATLKSGVGCHQFTRRLPKLDCSGYLPHAVYFALIGSVCICSNTRSTGIVRCFDDTVVVQFVPGMTAKLWMLTSTLPISDPLTEIRAPLAWCAFALLVSISAREHNFFCSFRKMTRLRLTMRWRRPASRSTTSSSR